MIVTAALNITCSAGADLPVATLLLIRQRAFNGTGGIVVIIMQRFMFHFCRLLEELLYLNIT